MAGAPDPASRLFVVGLNHRSLGAALRERLFAAEPDSVRLLAAVRAAGAAQAVVLATCERVELIAVDCDPEAARRGLVGALAEGAGLDPGELAGHTVRREGGEALRHLFAVAASLDSQVVGEPQILGQLKDSHRCAAEAGMVGPALERVLAAAYAAAKRVRSETPIAERPVSIAASALLVAGDVHGDLRRRRGLLIGLGEMGELMARQIKEAGLRDLVVVHPSLARAEAAARRLGCHFRPWDELAEALAAADIVVSARGTGRYTISAGQAEAALKRRRREAIFLIDAAVPADIDPAVEALDGAFVYDLEDLERVALRGKADRAAAAEAAWRIVEEEVAAFRQARAERAAGPLVGALRRHFEAVRGEVLAEDKLDAEEATRRVINRLLHDPSEALRAAAAGRAGGLGREALEMALRRLFRIPGEAGPADGPLRDERRPGAKEDER